MMKVKEAMTRDVHTVAPDATLRDAANAMMAADVGVLPVQEHDRLVGMITDRDIAVRAIAKGLGPDASVREVMTRDVKYCFIDADADDVTQNMGDIQVRRLPVVNDDKRLVGIVSLCDLAANGGTRQAGEALREIARPGGAHNQAAPPA